MVDTLYRKCAYWMYRLRESCSWVKYRWGSEGE